MTDAPKALEAAPETRTNRKQRRAEASKARQAAGTEAPQQPPRAKVYVVFSHVNEDGDLRNGWKLLAGMTSLRTAVQVMNAVALIEQSGEFKDVTIIKSPEGKTLKFVHRGSYDNMDNTYEAITNHLDEKKLEAKDTFIEEYTTDPLKTSEDKLVINVYVPLR